MTEEWKLVDYFPPWMEKRGSNNEKLLNPPEQRLEEFSEDIEKVNNQTNPITADRRDTLVELGRLVGEPVPENEVDFYQRKVLVEYMKNASQGTLPQLLTATSTLLDIDAKRIEYRGLRGDGGGVVGLVVPAGALDEVGASEDEVITHLNRFCSAGYSLELILEGQFVYISPEERNGGDYDEEYGHAGLDEDGEPTRDYNGYSGIVIE